MFSVGVCPMRASSGALSLVGYHFATHPVIRPSKSHTPYLLLFVFVGKRKDAREEREKEKKKKQSPNILHKEILLQPLMKFSVTRLYRPSSIDAVPHSCRSRRRGSH